MGVFDTFKDKFGLIEEDEENIVEQEKETEVSPKKRDSEGKSSGSKLSFVICKPEKFDESLSIGNHLLDKKVVVLNLESTTKESSRRIIDFLAGVSFALRGQVKKVSVATYIIVPSNSDISGEQLEELESGSMFL
ncbi:MAG: cell division protein SepF [Ruminococcaceae bacterium]|nr:cell division protein SepF [Oscillospiraceae bacterium]